MKTFKLNRRKFLKKAAIPVAASALISHPAVLSAKTKVELSLVTSWPSNFPGIGLGANRLANRIQSLSNNESDPEQTKNINEIFKYAIGVSNKLFDTISEYFKN